MNLMKLDGKNFDNGIIRIKSKGNKITFQLEKSDGIRTLGMIVNNEVVTDFGQMEGVLALLDELHLIELESPRQIFEIDDYDPDRPEQVVGIKLIAVNKSILERLGYEIVKKSRPVYFRTLHNGPCACPSCDPRRFFPKTEEFWETEDWLDPDTEVPYGIEYRERMN